MPTDNFNRANENPLAGNWTTVTSEDALRIVSNQVNGTVSNASCAAYWNADSFNDDQYSQVTCVDGAIANWNGPLVRVAAAAQTYYIFYRRTATVSRMYKCVAGAQTQLGADYAFSAAAGDVVRLTVSGTTLTPNVNSADLATRTDSAIASGSAGIKSNDDTDCTVDDWEGGNVAAGATPLTFSSSEALGSYADTDDAFLTHAATLQDDLNA